MHRLLIAALPLLCVAGQASAAPVAAEAVRAGDYAAQVATASAVVIPPALTEVGLALAGLSEAVSEGEQEGNESFFDLARQIMA